MEGDLFTVHVSFNSARGFTKHTTVKLRGTVHSKDMVIMIDPSATHNFICLKLVHVQQLQIHSLQNPLSKAAASAAM